MFSIHNVLSNADRVRIKTTKYNYNFTIDAIKRKYLGRDVDVNLMFIFKHYKQKVRKLRLMLLIIILKFF